MSHIEEQPRPLPLTAGRWENREEGQNMELERAAGARNGGGHEVRTRWKAREDYIGG